MRQPTRRRALIAASALPLAALLRSVGARPLDVDVPPPPSMQPSDVAAFLASAERAGGIEDGHSPHRLHVVYDPNCPYCHSLYTALRPYVDQGRVEVSWITVGILAPSSLPKAAAILQARDPLAALRLNEQRYGHAADSSRGGGVVAAKVIQPATRLRLERNRALLQGLNRYGVFGVPVVVWRGNDGAARMVVGSMTDSELGELMSLLA